MYNIEELNVRLLSELKEIAEDLGVKNYKKLPKKELIYKILDQQAILPDTELPVAKKSAKPESANVREEKKELITKTKDEDRRRPRVKRENVTDSEEPLTTPSETTQPAPPTSSPKKSESFLDTFKQEVSGSKPVTADTDAAPIEKEQTPIESEQAPKRESFPKREPIIRDIESDSEAISKPADQKISQDRPVRREERKDERNDTPRAKKPS